MNIKIKGHYKFIKDNKIILSKNNLITNQGEKYFLERWINNTSDILNIVSVGTGTEPPSKNDTSLNYVKAKHNPNKTVDYENHQIILSTTFSSSEINQTTEIGVSTNGTNSRLISRDVHEEINIPSSSTITLIYTFTIETSLIKKEWAQNIAYKNVYTTSEVNKVQGVDELDTNNGYILKTSISSVNSNTGSYFWDKNTNLLYIHTSDDDTPSNHKINVKY